jgi:putative hydrolase of the HAD superfamily
MDMLTTRPEAIIFDYGGVLEGPIDPVAFEADLAQLAREYGLQSGSSLWDHLYISPAWEKAKRGQITREAFWKDRLEALGISSEEEIHRFKTRLFRHRGIRPEMRALLAELHARYRLAVLSNTSRVGFEEYLRKHRQLEGLLDVVISSAEVGVAKPEPAIYLLTLARLEIRPEQALFIDDLERNTSAAEALGIPSIIFTSPAELCVELQCRGIV